MEYIFKVILKYKISLSFKNIALFFVFGVFLSFIGALTLSYSLEITQIKISYSDLNQCKTIKSLCNVSFTIDKAIERPVFVYYELHGFYQNYDQYMNSKNSQQLNGDNLEINQLSSCKPIITNLDLGGNMTSWNNTLLKDGDPANPCGLIAKTFFNDRYKLFYQNRTIPINEKEIIWHYEREMYKRSRNSENIQWIDPTNEHFIVWMRISAMNKFRKLWGKIETKLEIGEYVLQIENNYDVSFFNGEKHFFMSNSNSLGQKNDVLAYGCLLAGGINMLVFSILMILKTLSRYKLKRR